MKNHVYALAMALALCAAGAAHAQNDVAVICAQGDRALPVIANIPDNQKFSDSGTAFNSAIALARQRSITEIWVLPGTWQGPTAILEGLSAPSLTIRALIGTQLDTVVQGGAALSIFEVAGNEHVAFDGLSITDGPTGIYVRNGAVDINRCYIYECGENGVRASAGEVLVVNSVISRCGTNGVLIEGGSTEARVTSCTLLSHGTAGVAALGTRTVSIVNTIFKDNGTGATGNVTCERCDFFNNPGDPSPLPGPGPNLTVDPMFTLSLFEAKLDPLSPMVDEGKDLRSSPVMGYAREGRDYALEHFGDGQRPVLLPRVPAGFSPFDIGAYEVPATGGPLSIWFIEILPNPVGQLDAGELRIIFKTTDATTFFNPGDANYETGNKLLLVPSSIPFTNGQPLALDKVIALEVTYLGNNTWFATNIDSIETYLGSGVSATLVDGQAQVLAVSGSWNQIPYIDSDWEAQSKVLIDTIPPRLYINPAIDGLTGVDFISEQNPPAGGSVAVSLPNDTLRAETVGYPASLPPLPAIPQASVTIPSSGGLVENTPNGEGAALFFNAGAVNRPPRTPASPPTSPTAPSDLEFTIAATFIDPPPFTYPGGTTPAAVEVSGFDPALTVAPITGAAEAVLLNAIDPTVLPKIPVWRFDAGYPSAISPADVFTGEYFLGPNASSTKNTMVAKWTLVSAATTAGTSVPGIPWERVGNSAGVVAHNATYRNDWHVAVRFSAEDMAGNITEQDAILDPLHMWWLIDTNTLLQPSFSQRFRPESLQFNWRLQRPAGPTDPPDPASPHFAFRLYEKETDLENVAGDYVPISEPTLFNGWRGWSEETSVGTKWFEANNIIANHNSRWLMMVVIALDEAGNIQQWPFVGDPDRVSLTEGDAGETWVRFYIESPEASIDTRVAATFWWDRLKEGKFEMADVSETSYGAATVAPMAPNPLTSQLTVAFDLTAIAPGVDLDDDAELYWQLFEAGESPANAIAQGLPPGDSRRNPDALYSTSPLEVDAQGRVLVDGKRQPLVLPAGIVTALGDRVSFLLKLAPGNEVLEDDVAELLSEYRSKTGRSAASDEFDFDNLNRNSDPIVADGGTVQVLDQKDLVDAVQYVFRAWTVDTGSSPEREDLTPVNYYFTVVSQVEKFIQPQNRPEDQVFKVFER